VEISFKYIIANCKFFYAAIKETDINIFLSLFLMICIIKFGINCINLGANLIFVQIYIFLDLQIFLQAFFYSIERINTR